MRRIFRDTPDMIDYYEARAGVRYSYPVYTQVLAAGGVEQEMSSFTVMRETYGREVLANERAIWLGAHELAHQWWGNMVTCRAWTHFWLNEGMANFMTAAYLEHRFGREEYLRQIEEYRASYQKVRDAGKDRSLVFPDWLHRPQMTAHWFMTKAHTCCTCCARSWASAHFGRAFVTIRANISANQKRPLIFKQRWNRRAAKI